MRVVYTGSGDHLRRNTPYLVVDEDAQGLYVSDVNCIVEHAPFKGIGFAVDESITRSNAKEYLMRIDAKDRHALPKDYVKRKIRVEELLDSNTYCALPVLDDIGRITPSDSYIVLWDGTIAEVEGYMKDRLHSTPVMNFTSIMMCAWNLWHIGAMYTGFEDEGQADCNISTEGLQRVQARYKGNTVLERGRVHDAFMVNGWLLLVYGTDGRIKRMRAESFDISTTMDSEISDEDYAKRILASVPSAVSNKYQGSDISRALRVAYELLGL